MPKVCLPPFGFWSYVRRDDELSDGDISNLRALVEGYLERQTGETARIFQDTRAIEHGADWERETREALAQANFFIPVLTPNYLRSLWCCKEVRFFLDRQQQLFETYPDLPTRSRIFPILYTDIADVDSIQPEIRDVLASLQFFDFTELQFLPNKSPEVRRAVSGFAGDIRKLLQTRVEAHEEPPKPRPAPRKRPPNRKLDSDTAGSGAAAPSGASPVDPPPPRAESAAVQPTVDRRNLVPILVGFGIFGVLLLIVLMLAVIGSAGPAGDSSNTYVGDYTTNEVDMNMAADNLAMNATMTTDMNTSTDMITANAVEMTSNTTGYVPPAPTRPSDFWLINNCHRQIYFRLLYQRNGQWQEGTGMHWVIDGNRGIPLESGGQRIHPDRPEIYFQAEAVDGQWAWNGDTPRRYGSTSYNMNYFTASVDVDGDYTLTLTCNPT